MSTRGPWKSQGWVPTWAYIPIHDAQHNLICSMYPNPGRGYTSDEVMKNANLVAAAPELLELATVLRGWIEHWQEDRAAGLMPTAISMKTAIDTIDGVLAKAGA